MTNKSNAKSGDPYVDDSAFEEAREYMKNCLPEIEKVKGSKEERSKKIIDIFDEIGRKSNVLIPCIGPSKRKVVEDLVLKHEPKLAYDIGTLFGYSAISLSVNPHTTVITIQKSRKNMDIAKKVIAAAGLSERIKTVIGDATKIVPEFDRSIDMVLIDGFKMEYYQYLKLIEPYLKTGSVIIADNVHIFAHEMKDYLNHVQNSGDYESRTIKTLRAFSNTEEDALEVSIKIRH